MLRACRHAFSKMISPQVSSNLLKGPSGAGRSSGSEYRAVAAWLGGLRRWLPGFARGRGRVLRKVLGFRQSSKPRILDRLLFLPAFPSRGPWVSVEPVSVGPPSRWPNDGMGSLIAGQFANGMQRLDSALLSFYCLVGGWPLLAENSLRGDERLWASL